MLKVQWLGQKPATTKVVNAGLPFALDRKDEGIVASWEARERQALHSDMPQKIADTNEFQVCEACVSLPTPCQWTDDYMS